MKNILITLLATLGMVASVEATLIDTDDGLVSDTAQDITWLKDGNLIKTSCDTDNALWQAYDPESIAGSSGRTKTQICDDGGRPNWYEGEAWIAVLNDQNYLGYSDWRQPATGQPDPTCSDGNIVADYGYGCTNSEMGHLHSVRAPDGLGNPDDFSDDCGSECMLSTGPFENMQGSYWSGTDYPQRPDFAWRYAFSSGHQTGIFKFQENSSFYIWAVRSGAVASEPPQAIPTLSHLALVLMASLMLLLGLRQRAKSTAGINSLR